MSKDMLRPVLTALKRPCFSKCPQIPSRRVYSLQPSTVHRGNAFEERSLKLLEQMMSMSLKRVGGKEDGGIDLLGWWWLPLDDPGTSNSPSSTSQRRRIRIIGQCKAEKKKMGPGYVRELEGVLHRFLMMPPSPFSSSMSGNEDATFPASGQSHIPMVALLVSESPFTKSALLRAHSSPIPFFLLHLPPLEDQPDILSKPQVNEDDVDVDSPSKPLGNLGAALCNPALSGAQGLLMGQLEVRWERNAQGPQGRPALWWKNERLLSHIPDMAVDELLPSPNETEVNQ